MPAVLAGLRDASLLHAADGPTGRRLALLDTVRAVAADHLLDSGRSAAGRTAHVAVAVARAHAIASGIVDVDEGRWAAIADAELADLRLAVERAADEGDHPAAATIVTSLFQYAYDRIHPEIGGWADELLTLADDGGELRVSAALGAFQVGQLDRAMTLAGAAVDSAADETAARARIVASTVEIVRGHLDAAIDRALEWKAQGVAKSIGVPCNAVDLLARLVAREIVPDVLTDQTSAHDPLGGYVPSGMSLEDAVSLRESDPARYQELSFATMVEHCRLMIDLQARGADTFDYGNNLRGHAREGGLENAFDFEGFVPKYVRPLFCEGKGPFRWAALSGDPNDIAVTDQIVLDLFPEDHQLARWIRMAGERVAFQGLPARICWLGYGERARAGRAFNEAVADGRISAPVVIGRDHLDCGSVASPNRETEAMKDGTDAVADWPILNALVNASCGASWVSFHHGGGVGMGYSLHAGQVTVADGTPEAAEALERVLTADPGMGVLRHVDAGYAEAEACARDRDVDVPMLD